MTTRSVSQPVGGGEVHGVVATEAGFRPGLRLGRQPIDLDKSIWFHRSSRS
jgi:hypothetical protein